MDLSSDEHGNQTKMPGKCRVMCSLDRSDRRFARFDTVEEVPAMFSRLIELHLAEFLRQRFTLDPGGIGGAKSCPIHPHPAVCPNPLCPYAYCRRTAGNGHGNVHGIVRHFLTIFAFDVVFGCGVPGSICRRKLAIPFNLRWTCKIESQPPV